MIARHNAAQFWATIGAIFAVPVLYTGCFTCPKPLRVEPEVIRALVDKIDEDPYKLHADLTPAVDQLSEMGPQVIPYVLPLMESTNWVTRLHAVRVMHFTTMGMYCFVRGRGWPHDRSRQRWIDFWRAMGSLRYDGTDAERAKAIQTWRVWLDEHQIHPVQPLRPANGG